MKKEHFEMFKKVSTAVFGKNSKCCGFKIEPAEKTESRKDKCCGSKPDLDKKTKNTKEKKKA